jgi:hypothetical protein
MKKMILVLTTLAIAGASVQTASAGGGWSTAGKVLAGVTAGVVIGEALAPRPVYYAAPAPVYYAAPAPVVYAAPAPVVVYRPVVRVAAPCVSVGFGFYGGCRPHYYHRGCW